MALSFGRLTVTSVIIAKTRSPKRNGKMTVPPVADSTRSLPNNGTILENRRSLDSTSTPTNRPIAEILEAVEEGGFENLLSPPGKTRKPSGKKDKTKYCRFHKDHGYDTSTCYALKDQIEDLIRRGYLKKYVGSRDIDEPTASNKDNR